MNRRIGEGEWRRREKAKETKNGKLGTDQKVEEGEVKKRLGNAMGKALEKEEENTGGARVSHEMHMRR